MLYEFTIQFFSVCLIILDLIYIQKNRIQRSYSYLIVVEYMH